MFTIQYHAGNRHECRTVETLWAANLLAWKYVSDWGWETAFVIDAETGEFLRSYVRGRKSP